MGEPKALIGSAPRRDKTPVRAGALSYRSGIQTENESGPLAEMRHFRRR